MATPEAALPALQRRRFMASAEAPLAAVIGAAIIAVLVLVAIFAPLIAPADPNAVDLTNALQPPSADHLLGTDSSGRGGRDASRRASCSTAPSRRQRIRR